MPKSLFQTVKRLPWALVPFVLSMFIIVLALQKQRVTDLLCSFLGENNAVLTYGLSSFIACNLMNNIPMSVLFSVVPSMPTALQSAQATYASIIGSNIGAFLTPIGALAGIMFTQLIAKQKVEYGFKQFVKYGILTALPTLFSALLGLYFIL